MASSLSLPFLAPDPVSSSFQLSLRSPSTSPSSFLSSLPSPYPSTLFSPLPSPGISPSSCSQFPSALPLPSSFTSSFNHLLLPSSTSTLSAAEILCNPDIQKAINENLGIEDPVGEDARKKRKRKKAKKGDPLQPSRPMNSYFLYRRAVEINLTSTSIEDWITFTDEQKAPWVEAAKEVQKQHKILYPDYKYKPAKPKKKSNTNQASLTGNAILEKRPPSNEILSTLSVLTPCFSLFSVSDEVGRESSCPDGPFNAGAQSVSFLLSSLPLSPNSDGSSNSPLFMPRFDERQLCPTSSSAPSSLWRLPELCFDLGDEQPNQWRPNSTDGDAGILNLPTFDDTSILAPLGSSLSHEAPPVLATEQFPVLSSNLVGSDFSFQPTPYESIDGHGSNILQPHPRVPQDSNLQMFSNSWLEGADITGNQEFYAQALADLFS